MQAQPSRQSLTVAGEPACSHPCRQGLHWACVKMLCFYREPGVHRSPASSYTWGNRGRKHWSDTLTWHSRAYPHQGHTHSRLFTGGKAHSSRHLLHSAASLGELAGPPSLLHVRHQRSEQGLPSKQPTETRGGKGSSGRAGISPQVPQASCM